MPCRDMRECALHDIYLSDAFDCARVLHAQRQNGLIQIELM